MFRKILYPTDFSDVSKNALSYLKQLKKSGVEEIFVLHVIDKRDVQFSYLYLFDESSPDGNLEQKLKDEATRELKEIEGKLKEWGFKVLSRVKLGSPIKEILSAEQKEDISIIVIGSHGKSNIEEMLLGSVSENIIRKCKKPVLVVKRRRGVPGGETGVEKPVGRHQPTADLIPNSEIVRLFSLVDRALRNEKRSSLMSIHSRPGQSH